MKLKKRSKSLNDIKGVSILREPENKSALRLVTCAIMRPDGTLLQGGKTHSDVRSKSGLYEDNYTHSGGDIEGYMDSTGTFLPRYQASIIAAKSGQAMPMHSHSNILSCDVSGLI